MQTYHPQSPLPQTLSIGEKLGVVVHSSQDVPRALSQGLPLKSLTFLAEQLAVSQLEMLRLTDISEASLRRRRKTGHFLPQESERIYRYAEVFQAALELFEDEVAARDWLKRPRGYFQDTAPLEVARSEYGARRVLLFIAQLEAGTYV